jgi:hypothetical protein
VFVCVTPSLGTQGGGRGQDSRRDLAVKLVAEQNQDAASVSQGGCRFRIDSFLKHPVRNHPIRRDEAQHCAHIQEIRRNESWQ